MKSTAAILTAAVFTAAGSLHNAAHVSARTVCPAPPTGAVCGHPEFDSCGLIVNGVNRHFCLHVPALLQTGMPVVFNFHGTGGQAEKAAVDGISIPNKA